MLYSFVLALLVVSPTPVDHAAADGSRALPREVQIHIDQLDADDFVQRESAARWLVVHRDRWKDSVSPHWFPATPEARWRWRWIQERVAQLADFRHMIGDDDLEIAVARVGRLRLEVGEAVLDELSAIAAQHPRSRRRQRALEILGRLAPSDLVERLDALRHDESPWVLRTVFELAARVDRVWLRRVLTDIVHGRTGRSEEVIAEAARAIRLHRLPELLDTVRDHWDDLGPVARVEAGLALAGRPRRSDVEVYLWMIESGDYRVLVDGTRALEEVADRGALGTEELGRFTDATMASSFPEVRARARRFLEKHGSARLALDLLPHLESAEFDTRQFSATILIAWGAEDYFGDLDHVTATWPAEERVVRFEFDH